MLKHRQVTGLLALFGRSSHLSTLCGAWDDTQLAWDLSSNGAGPALAGCWSHRLKK